MAGWFGIIFISALLIFISFFFTLSFFENLHKGDERITKQSKLAALICLGIAFVIPFLYVFFIG
ncbi:hypothetical protein [Sporosarcina highlanderae]|uniref:Uncharacterized protein n=1 Tax=Sporosarcina highlanderae TaxID=3035916 RepID=A0ABT8JRN5_9BACL|nr:hypothetical protein [Sporosarcina highlanderae]MDN4607201.1 hypothetical protein [Sporosarcina highlanderae]